MLFTADESLDTTPLLNELRAEFGRDWFTIEQAQRVTLLSPFKDSHLKKRTLKWAEEDLGAFDVSAQAVSAREPSRPARG